MDLNKEHLLNICQENGMKNYELYNTDETGLQWKPLPQNTVSSKKDAKFWSEVVKAMHLSVAVF